MNSEKRFLDTNEFASAVKVKGDTIRRGLCLRGHYMNIVPKKLPNNRLLWPVAEVEKILNDAVAVSDAQ